MILRAAPLLASALLLAACGGQSGEAVQQQEVARAGELEQVQGWDRVFGAPDATVATANQFGFRAGAYGATGATPAYRSTGGPVMVGSSSAATPDTLGFAAEGAEASRIDTLRFDLALTGDPAAASVARGRMADLVRDFLFNAGIDAAALLPAIREGVAARGDLTGTRYEIVPADGRLTVTFHRSGASAPTNSEPQGK